MRTAAEGREDSLAVSKSRHTTVYYIAKGGKAACGIRTWADRRASAKALRSFSPRGQVCAGDCRLRHRALQPEFVMPRARSSASPSCFGCYLLPQALPGHMDLLPCHRTRDGGTLRDIRAIPAYSSVFARCSAARFVADLRRSIKEEFFWRIASVSAGGAVRGDPA